jgi:alpha-mannosidase
MGDDFGLCSFDDNADPWGMGRNQLIRLGTNEQKFTLSKEPDGPFKGMKSVQVIENGDIYLGIEAFFECDNTRARILYKIYKNNDDVDIDVNLYMCDINKIVKLKLPIAKEGNLIGQTAFGTDTLFMDARENVAHRFVAVDTGANCVALLNKDVYGSHYENKNLYMSLVRGVTYCAHPIGERQLIPMDRFTKKIDQGENNFSFRLTLVQRNQLERKCGEFVQKPYCLNIFPVPMEIVNNSSFDVSIDGDTISMPTVKKADGKDAVIFRLFNNTANTVSSGITVNGQKLPLIFGKYEVKTVVYENNTLTESYELLI